MPFWLGITEESISVAYVLYSSALNIDAVLGCSWYFPPIVTSIFVAMLRLRLVVMSTTPLAPFAPYMAVPFFITSTLSMSLTLMLARMLLK